MCLTVRLLCLVGFFISICGSHASEYDYEEFEHAGPPATGIQRTSDTRRIHAGVLSRVGDFKFIVGLRVRAAIADPTLDYEEDVGNVCTGAVVGARFVLTASHCLPRVVVYLAAVGEEAVEGFSYSNVRFEIFAGTVDMRAPNKDTMQRFEAWYPSELTLHVHPEAFRFRKKITDSLRGKLMKDFLLLELLENSFRYNEFVTPIPILKTPIPKMMSGNCKAVGFGNQDDVHVKRDSKLYHIDVKVGGSEYCDKLRGRPYRKTYHVCALGEGMRDTCAGDSGGPLVCGTPDGYYMLGVLSLGSDNINRKGRLKGCGETNTSFGLYVYPGSVEDWVTNITKEVQYITMEVAENLRDHPVTYPEPTTSAEPLQTSAEPDDGVSTPTQPPLIRTSSKKTPQNEPGRKEGTNRKSNHSNSLHSTQFGQRITEALFIWGLLLYMNF